MRELERKYDSRLGYNKKGERAGPSTVAGPPARLPDPNAMMKDRSRAQPTDPPVGVAARTGVPVLLPLEGGEHKRVRVELGTLKRESELHEAIRRAAAAVGVSIPMSAGQLRFEILRADGFPELVSESTTQSALQTAKAVTVFRRNAESLSSSPADVVLINEQGNQTCCCTLS